MRALPGLRADWSISTVCGRYTIDADTLLVQAEGGEALKQAKDFALMQPEIYEFEFQQNKFRRPEDTMTHDELKASLGLKTPSPPTPPPPPAKKSKGKKGKKKAKGKKGKEEL